MTAPASAPLSPGRGSIRPPSTTTSTARTGYIARCCARRSAGLTENQLSQRRGSPSSSVARAGAQRALSAANCIRSWRATRRARHIRIFNWESGAADAGLSQIVERGGGSFHGGGHRPDPPVSARRGPSHPWWSRQSGSSASAASSFATASNWLARRWNWRLDEASVEWLAQLISRWATGALQSAG